MVKLMKKLISIILILSTIINVNSQAFASIAFESNNIEYSLDLQENLETSNVIKIADNEDANKNNVSDEKISIKACVSLSEFLEKLNSDGIELDLTEDEFEEKATESTVKYRKTSTYETTAQDSDGNVWEVTIKRQQTKSGNDWITDEWYGEAINTGKVEDDGTLETWDEVYEHIKGKINVEDSVLKETINDETGEHLIKDKEGQSWLITITASGREGYNRQYTVKMVKTDENTIVSDEYMSLDEVIKTVSEELPANEDDVKSIITGVGTFNIKDLNGDNWVVKIHGDGRAEIKEYKIASMRKAIESTTEVGTAHEEDEDDFGGELFGLVAGFVMGVVDAVVGAATKIMGYSTTARVMFSRDDIQSSTEATQGVNYGNSSKNVDVIVDGSELEDNYKFPVYRYTSEEIIAGEVPICDVKFIGYDEAFHKDKDGNDDDWVKIRKIIVTWYRAFNVFALIGFLSVLIYIGIKIMLSSAAESKAKYKESFVGWIKAIMILALLPLIMSFTLTVAEQFTKMFKTDNESTFNVTVFVEDGKNGSCTFDTNLMGLLRFSSQNKSGIIKMAYLILYVMMVTFTIKFTFLYLKRMFYMGILTIMAPMTAIMYPIEVANGGKGKSFDQWLREFIFNAIMQPIQWLIYYIFVGSAISLTAENPLYGIIVLAFISKAEEIIKNILGLKEPMKMVGGISGTLSVAAMASSAAKVAKKVNAMNNKVRTKDKSEKDDDTDNEENSIAQLANAPTTEGIGNTTPRNFKENNENKNRSSVTGYNPNNMEGAEQGDTERKGVLSNLTPQNIKDRAYTVVDGKIKAIQGNITDKVNNTVEGVKNGLSNIQPKNMVKKLRNAPKAMKDKIYTAKENSVNKIKGKITGIKNNVSSTVTGIKNKVENFDPEKVKKKIKNAPNAMKDKIYTAKENSVNKIKGKITGIKNNVSSTVIGIKNKVENFDPEEAKKKIKNIPKAMANKAYTAAKGTKDKIVAMPGKIKEGVIEKAKEIKDTPKAIVGVAKKKVDKAVKLVTTKDGRRKVIRGAKSVAWKGGKAVAKTGVAAGAMAIQAGVTLADGKMSPLEPLITGAAAWKVTDKGLEKAKSKTGKIANAVRKEKYGKDYAKGIERQKKFDQNEKLKEAYRQKYGEKADENWEKARELVKYADLSKKQQFKALKYKSKVEDALKEKGFSDDEINRSVAKSVKAASQLPDFNGDTKSEEDWIASRSGGNPQKEALLRKALENKRKIDAT